MKVVINKCYGGFSLSPKATLLLFELGYDGDDFKIPTMEYFKNSIADLPESLDKWRKYVEKPTSSTRMPLNIFSLDGKYVLYARNIERDNVLLVKIVEKLGHEANGSYARLKVVEIPDGTKYEIEEYDGMEHIAETHETWG